MISKKSILKRFLAYVRIDSPSKEEGRFAKHIKNELKRIGIKPKEDNAARRLDGQSGNIYASIPGNVAKAPRVLINAHLDTVRSGVGIRPRIRRGIVYSDGKTILGADNKAGVAVMMEVAKALTKDNIPHGQIDLLFTVAEEIGLMGSKFLDRRSLEADFGYVLDGGDVDEIINKAPSQDSIEAKIIGRAAHAGVRPEKGINAIKVASEAIAKMKLGRIDRETTANIGMIEGGVATNIVPESVTLKGEARSHDIGKLRKQVLHMKSMLTKACKKHKARLYLRITPAYRSFEVKRSNRALKIALISAEKVGLRPKIKATGGGSDANIFARYGIPCLIIGAGADSVHTARENVAINDMWKSAQFLLEIIKNVTRDIS